MNNDELKQRFIEKLKAGASFTLRECSICGAQLTFFARRDTLFFDPSCYCTRGYGPEETDWSKLDFYLEPTHGHVSRIEEFCKS